jgi:hypothetical protein
VALHREGFSNPCAATSVTSGVTRAHASTPLRSTAGGETETSSPAPSRAATPASAGGGTRNASCTPGFVRARASLRVCPSVLTPSNARLPLPAFSRSRKSHEKQLFAGDSYGETRTRTGDTTIFRHRARAGERCWFAGAARGSVWAGCRWFPAVCGGFRPRARRWWPKPRRAGPRGSPGGRSLGRRPGLRADRRRWTRGRRRPWLVQRDEIVVLGIANGRRWIVGSG